MIETIEIRFKWGSVVPDRRKWRPSRPYLEPIAKALKRDNYQGVVSLESVYHPLNGTYEDGYRECLPKFKELFE